jgi:hypothetical protein
MVSYTITDALRESNREALMSLVLRLGQEIDESTDARDRLPLVRAFLAAVTALEALDNAAHRRARDEARSSGSVDSGAPLSAVDDLLERRRRRERQS